MEASGERGRFLVRRAIFRGRDRFFSIGEPDFDGRDRFRDRFTQNLLTTKKNLGWDGFPPFWFWFPPGFAFPLVLLGVGIDFGKSKPGGKPKPGGSKTMGGGKLVQGFPPGFARGRDRFFGSSADLALKNNLKWAKVNL